MPKKLFSPKTKTVKLKRPQLKLPNDFHKFLFAPETCCERYNSNSDRYNTNSKPYNTSSVKTHNGSNVDYTFRNGPDSNSDRYFSNDTTTDEEDSDLKPVQRNAANARERARMRILSKAFFRLKTTLPWVPKDTKLSKLDTLRLASSYILHLKLILSQDTRDKLMGPQVLNVNWPFGLQSREYLDQTQQDLQDFETEDQ